VFAKYLFHQMGYLSLIMGGKKILGLVLPEFLFKT